MKIKMLIMSLFMMCIFPTYVHADIVNILRMIENYTGRILGHQASILNSQNAMMDMQRQILRSQNDIEGLMRQVNNHLSGHAGWGNYQFRDYQSYGDDARNWSNVLNMAERGEGQGGLGQMMHGLSDQFPLDNYRFNNGIHNAQQQKYYALKSQTVLASRASSQLDYNKIEDQIAYQHLLQQSIEKTDSLKAAVDLANRIQVEGNLINLSILRQIALLNQQQAVTEQAEVVSALANAKFLTK